MAGEEDEEAFSWSSEMGDLRNGRVIGVCCGRKAEKEIMHGPAVKV